MNLTTKGDLVLAALRKLGVASDATLTDVEPQSVEDGVNDLEMMMAEWLEGDGQTPGIDAGYTFSAPDVAPVSGDAHGMEIGKISSVFHNLALRIAPDYAVEPPSKVVTAARYGKERLVRMTAMSRASHAKNLSGYPNRMPVGSGNRLATYNGWNFYRRKEPFNNGSE